MDRYHFDDCQKSLIIPPGMPNLQQENLKPAVKRFEAFDNCINTYHTRMHR
jgi:hypothetical protein